MKAQQKPTTGIAAAVKAAGSQERLADRLGVSQQAISQWLKAGYVPLLRALEIEAQFGIARARLISPRIAGLVDLPEAGA